MKKKLVFNSKLRKKIYNVYGIFDFKTNTLLCVNLKKEEIYLEYDLEGYDEERFDVIKFELLMG